MQAIDLLGHFHQILDADRKIPKAHLEHVCKLHKGSATCRYIGLGINGFACAKNTKMKEAFDKQVREGKFTAKGDNCEGLGNINQVMGENNVEKEKTKE